MKHVLGVCLIALLLTVSPTSIAAAQSQAVGPLRKGVTVQLPVTNNAVAVPQADSEDSMILTITPEGSTYLGADRISAVNWVLD